MLPLLPRLVSLLRPRLRHWRTRGRSAGALCNLLRLRAEEVECCCGELLEALKEEVRERPELPGLPPATLELLGALVNLAVTRPQSLAEMQRLGALELIVPLIEAKAYESGTVEIGHRALQLAGRLVAFASAAPKELLARLRGVLEVLEKQSTWAAALSECS